MEIRKYTVYFKSRTDGNLSAKKNKVGIIRNLLSSIYFTERRRTYMFKSEFWIGFPNKIWNGELSIFPVMNIKLFFHSIERNHCYCKLWLVQRSFVISSSTQDGFDNLTSSQNVRWTFTHFLYIEQIWNKEIQPLYCFYWNERITNQF